jgi:hypothetical protein
MLENRISKLANDTNDRKAEEKAVVDALRLFSSTLYTEFNKIIQAAIEQGISDLGNIQRHRLDGGLESFSFDWGKLRLIISQDEDRCLTISCSNQNRKTF